MDIHISPLMIISGLALGLLSARLAYKKERNPYLWFALGFLFGIFGICAIFFAPKRSAAVPNPEPLATIQGPTDKFWYYLDPAEQQQGPMSHDALSIAWKEGKVAPTTLVWHEDMSNWTPLKEVLSPNKTG